MRFDLKKPCKHCPFVNGPDRIRFACRERAEEIEELAYRQGFVCHEHGESREDDEDGGIEFRLDGSSQHCWGALAMYLHSGTGNIPWEDRIAENPELEERWWNRADMAAFHSVFENEELFLEANDASPTQQQGEP